MSMAVWLTRALIDCVLAALLAHTVLSSILETESMVPTRSDKIAPGFQSDCGFLPEP
jgi:hypothetical protein